ncbi:hypothetical protein [Rodentibacter caecimuris]|uniref:Uncharacterized protein n=1 Tax=Rodentibacter caecimuris TaxID=1796644 RepID=A0ABX3KZS1_9PAST|nr:hypothetical protein BKG89_03180 [Rodentibacter heylii]
MHKLLLMVTHAFMLEKGTLPHCYFDESGGMVGGGVSSDWKINNLKGDFSDTEFEIKYYDNYFCLIAHTENIFINGSTQPLSLGGIIKLNDSDLISLFSYNIRVKISTNKAEVVTLQDELFHLVNKLTENNIFNSSNNQPINFQKPMGIHANGNLLTQEQKELTLDPLSALKIDPHNGEQFADIVTTSSTDLDYKFFNPHINVGLEYYEPMKSDVSSSNDKMLKNPCTNIEQNRVLSQDNLSSSDRVDILREEVVLDPLFFIK